MVDGPSQGAGSRDGKEGNLAKREGEKNSLAHIEPFGSAVRLTKKGELEALVSTIPFMLGILKATLLLPLTFTFGKETCYGTPTNDFPCSTLFASLALMMLCSAGPESAQGWL